MDDDNECAIAHMEFRRADGYILYWIRARSVTLYNAKLFLLLLGQLARATMSLGVECSGRAWSCTSVRPTVGSTYMQALSLILTVCRRVLRE
jgi:hypothetical protein